MTCSAVYGGALGRIRFQAATLSPSLQRATQHVLQDADNATRQTITELATHVDVSEATITRLCRKLDFAGFKEFI